MKNKDQQHRDYRTDWETPPDVFALIDAQFKFDVDVCASAKNAKCNVFFDKATDGLRQDWGQLRCFMNPPFGKENLISWLSKAEAAARRGALVVAILPATLETQWFKAFVLDKKRPFLVWPRRVSFIHPTEAKNQPTGGTVVTLFYNGNLTLQPILGQGWCFPAGSDCVVLHNMAVAG